jgi:hypothetical protein
MLDMFMPGALLSIFGVVLMTALLRVIGRWSDSCKRRIGLNTTSRMFTCCGFFNGTTNR